MRTSPLWSDFDRLVSEHKLQAAFDVAERIRQNAATDPSKESEVAESLIQQTQLRIALHGDATAVRFLSEAPWPKTFLQRTILELYLGEALHSYVRSYAWEVRQRTRIDSAGELALEQMTADQIIGAALTAYQRIWAARTELDDASAAALGPYLEPGDYPDGVRDTLRDLLTYQAVSILADTTHWRPEQSSDLHALDLDLLLASPTRAVDLDDAAVHPLARLCHALDDLERWHTQGSRAAAALEARLERCKRLHAAFSEPMDRARIEQRLESVVREFPRSGWWSVAQATLARLLLRSGHRVRADELALAGALAKDVDSRGRAQCSAISESIRQPEFKVQARQQDGPGRRSILVEYKNLRVLYFRAFALDLEKQLWSGQDYHALPGYPDFQRIWRESRGPLTGRPAAQWSIELPETTDFEMHRVYVTPPVTQPGLYVVMVSARNDFEDTTGNRLCAASVVISNLAILCQPTERGLEVLVVRGTDGAPVPGAEVVLGRYGYAGKHTLVAKVVTTAVGEASLRVSPGQDYGLFLTAKKDGDVALQTHCTAATREARDDIREILHYTDRSIYRPEQTLYFKVIIFAGTRAAGKLEVCKGEPVTVVLEDANHEKVASCQLKTNDFGSASGSFEIPAGRLLGAWTLRAGDSAGVTVRVEEYKRPTFEVELDAPESALRLNAVAELRGRARYYFGSPVSGGRVVWKVERQPRLPPWWFWGGENRPTRVASGMASLDANGTFQLAFTPAADPRKQHQQGLSYVYAVEVQVTDEGGETRKSTRRFRLGHTSIESDIALDKAFALADSPVSLRVRRQDLDGNARAGQGGWWLSTVRQPSGEVPGPADLPLAGEPSAVAAFPDDVKRPRWDASYAPERVMAAWPDGATIASGQMVHGEDGNAVLQLPPLTAGVYRFHYETRDEQGRKHVSSKTFLSVAASTPVALPAILEAEASAVPVGGTARLFVASGTYDQVLYMDRFRQGRRVERKLLRPGDPELHSIAVEKKDRGGFSVVMFTVRDFQRIEARRAIMVPWDDKELTIELATFRDRLRPGTRETWKVVLRGPDGSPLGGRVAELLAYMYDRSLETFAPHHPPAPLGSYPTWLQSSAPYGEFHPVVLSPFFTDHLRTARTDPAYQCPRFRFFPRYGIGGPGARGMTLTQSGMLTPGMPMPRSAIPAPMAPAPMAAPAPQAPGGPPVAAGFQEPGEADADSPPEPEVEIRTNFAETAFFLPHLVTDEDGAIAISFDVPDSVTDWSIWLHAITRDVLSGVIRKEARTVKALMVRPYVPRFLREGDRATLRVMVNNASDDAMSGTVRLRIVDSETDADVGAEFAISARDAEFQAGAGGACTVSFDIQVPQRPGSVAFIAEARAGSESDGEKRPLPILPSRVHLAQSRFVTLRGVDKRTMQFADMANGDDPTLVHDALVVSIDAQLFYTVLKALPYLVEYPYECCEQVLNRFVSSSIVTSVYERIPSVAAMAKSMAARETPLERWDQQDPNRRMQLEEVPWLREARGLPDTEFPLVAMLDPSVAARHRKKSLAQLEKAQTALGGLPWFPGGPPSPFMTLYALEGLARALEFDVAVPETMVHKAWKYLTRHFRADIFPRLRSGDLPPPSVVFLLYTLFAYKDASLRAEAFTEAERNELIDYAWAHWRENPPMLSLQLALTLHRLNRFDDARLVLDAVMDSSRTEPDRGTHWAAEARSWLWYNDTTETHAFALRVLSELRPQDERRDGLVLWLLLDKKLNQWKSTKATAAVIHALVHHMLRDGSLGVQERARVSVGSQSRAYTFEPDRYTGKGQWVLDRAELGPLCASVGVEKDTPGVMFASAVWHFSTESVPEARGDFFHVARSFFRRITVGSEMTLQPLMQGEPVAVGDEVEVHLSIRTEHAAEYVHVRDPRPAGFEPEAVLSGWRSDLGLFRYEEVRDSGMNFFFERLPTGEYTLKHRLRASMAGRFRVHPATMQSMYAPEFCAYSSGAVVDVLPSGTEESSR